MGLTPEERFWLVDEVVQCLLHDPQWSAGRIRRLYATHSLHVPETEPEWAHPGEWESELSVPLAASTDGVLLSIQATVIPGRVQSARQERSQSDSWRPGEIRLFLSHMAQHKSFASEVADHLAVDGIHGFVAHSDIEVSQEWQTEIEGALRTCDVFVALAHHDFWTRPWTNQEVGWAWGRKPLPSVYVDLGAGDPLGFPQRLQSVKASTPEDVAEVLGDFVYKTPELGHRVSSARIASLSKAQSYKDAEAKARRVVACAQLSDEEWGQLARVCDVNDQIHGSILARRVLVPFFTQNGKALPSRMANH